MERCRYEQVQVFVVQIDLLTALLSEHYTKLCTIDIDLSRVPLTPRNKTSGGGTFFRLDYDIVLLFGLTELKALIVWKENVR